MNNFLIEHHLLQQNLILYKSCFDTSIIMQNRKLCSGNQKFQKIEKYHNQMWFWRKVPRSSKTSNCRKMKTNIIQAQQLSIWDIWQNMWMESGDLLSKYQIITILLLHLRRIQCIDVWMILGIVVVTVLWEERATTTRPVLNAPELW